MPPYLLQEHAVCRLGAGSTLHQLLTPFAPLDAQGPCPAHAGPPFFHPAMEPRRIALLPAAPCFGGYMMSLQRHGAYMMQVMCDS